MATKTQTKAKAKKSQKPLTVPRRTNLPKLSLLPAPKPEAAAAATTAAEPAPAKPIPAKPVPKAPKAKLPKAERPSALNAAAEVLADASTPMTAPQLIVAMAERKLWTSPGGKTPGATLHAAISKEIATKGTASRFRKVGRGLFAATPPASDSTPAEVAGIETTPPELS